MSEGSNRFVEHPIDWNDKHVERVWDYYSRTRPFSEVYFSKQYGKYLLRESEVSLKAELEVLDFGCGPGDIFNHLEQAGARWKYTAVDFSPESVDAMNARAQSSNQFKGAHHITGVPTALKPASYDVVLLFEVVEHLVDAHLVPTIGEVHRLLKPGGLVVVSTPNEEDLDLSKKFCPDCGAIFHEWQHVRSWSRSTLSKAFEEQGFALARSQVLDFKTFGMQPENVLARVARAGKLLFGRGRPNPHMICVFRK